MAISRWSLLAIQTTNVDIKSAKNRTRTLCAGAGFAPLAYPRKTVDAAKMLYSLID